MASSHTAFEFANGEEGSINTPGHHDHEQNTNKRRGNKGNKRNQNRLKNNKKNHHVQRTQPQQKREEKAKEKEVNNNNTKKNEVEILLNDENNQQKEQREEGHIDNRLLYTKFNYPTPSNENITFISHSRHDSNRSNSAASYSHSRSYSFCHGRNDSNLSSISQISDTRNPIYNSPTYPPPFTRSSNLDIDANHLSVSLPQSHFYPTPQSSFDSLSSPTELSRLQHWLSSFGLQNIYQKLIKAGYDSIELFAECDDDDIKQIATDHKLSHAQSLKLRKAIKSLTKQHRNHNQNIHGFDFNNINVNNQQQIVQIKQQMRENHRRDNSILITENEKKSMMEIADYLENIQECYKIIETKMKLLDTECKNRENEICEEFSKMFNVLHQRKLNLMNELHFIYATKKDVFEKTLKDLNVAINKTKSSQKQCSQLILSQSIKNYANDIRTINEIEKHIVNIKKRCTQNIGPINVNTKIKLNINNHEILQIMAVLGDVEEDEQCRNQQIVYRPNDDKQEEKRYLNDDDDDGNGHQRREFRFDPHDTDEEDEELKVMEINNERREKDEWRDCGENLRIVRATYSRCSKIVNIGKRSNDSTGVKRGSGYGSLIVNKGVHYWQIKILYGNLYRDNLTFAIGFVANKYGTVKKNNWFLSHPKSFGLYNDSQIYCGGRKKSDNGIIIQNRDIINLCLDFNKSAFYVQRCEFIDQSKSKNNKNSNNNSNSNSNRKRRRHSSSSSSSPPSLGSPVAGMDYKVHSAKRIPIKRFGIKQLSDSYRLACYLREKNNSITILDYSTEPFPEWNYGKR